jgi:Abortive infection C-terminus
MAKPEGDAALERVILRVADPRDYSNVPEKGQAVIERLNTALEADGYAVMIVGGKPQLVTRQAGGAIVSAVIQKISVAKGIGALRTHGGDAHGREKGFRRIDSRIARVAINAAGSLTLFLIETWEQQQHRALPLRIEAA